MSTLRKAGNIQSSLKSVGKDLYPIHILMKIKGDEKHFILKRPRPVDIALLHAQCTHKMKVCLCV